MRDGLGDWIGRRQRLGVERQGKDANKELKVCGIPWKPSTNSGNIRGRLSSHFVLVSTHPHYINNSHLIHLDAPARLKKELDIVLGLQSDINTVKATLTSTCSMVSNRKIPPEALRAIESLKQNHTCLLQNVEVLYTLLNIGDTFPELEGLSLDFVHTLLLARDLEINICKRAIANFLRQAGQGRWRQTESIR